MCGKGGPRRLPWEKEADTFCSTVRVLPDAWAWEGRGTCIEDILQSVHS